MEKLWQQHSAVSYSKKCVHILLKNFTYTRQCAEHIQPPAPLLRMTRLKSSLGARSRLRQNVTRTMQQGC